MNVFVTCPTMPFHNKVVYVIHVTLSVMKMKIVLLKLKIVEVFSNTLIITWKYVLLGVSWLTLILTFRLDGTIKTMMVLVNRQNGLKVTTWNVMTLF